MYSVCYAEVPGKGWETAVAGLMDHLWEWEGREKVLCAYVKMSWGGEEQRIVFPTLKNLETVTG